MCFAPDLDLPKPPKPPATPPPPTPMAKAAKSPARKKRREAMQSGTSALTIRRTPSVNTAGLNQSSGIGLY